MSAAERAQAPQSSRDRREAIAERWQRALAQTGFVSLGVREARQRLAELADQASTLLLAEPFDRRAAQPIGAALARLHYGHPEALSRTQEVLACELVAGLPAERAVALQPRLAALLGAVAAGFLGQARDTTLAEQETVRHALLTTQQQAQEALRESEARFRAIFDAAAIGMGVGDMDGRILEANQALLALLGYSEEELRQLVVAQFMHPDDAQAVWGLYHELVTGQREHCRVEKRFYHKDGREVWSHLTASLVRDADGRPRFQIAMIEDTTARKRAEEALRQSEERFRALVRHASDIITVLDAAGIICYESPSVERVLGYRPGDLLGTGGFALVHPDDLAWALNLFAEVLHLPGVHRAIEVRMRHRDGSWRHIEVVGNNLLDDPSVGGVVVNSRDITERKAFEEQLRHQAFHDPLTGLPNRALFLERLERARARGGRHQGVAAVLFLDLDRFKVINDSLGHEVGDRLLVAVAGRLQGCLRPGDTAARLGGDEFTLLLEDLAAPGEATRVAERIAAVLQAPFTLGGHEVVISTSIGIVLGTAGYDQAADLLRDADVAMYRAKARGKARHEVFDPSMNAAAIERLGLEVALRRAVERGGFVVHYQPNVALATGQIEGMEALVRWEHPERGLVPPAAFIGLAEEMDLIRPLGGWVLGEACRQARVWHERYPSDPPLAMCVNLSARQLQHPELAEEIARALRDTGLPPHRLQLEITESVIMEDAPATIATLRQLKGLGVQLAIDDFGTGYSSLSYLKRFPVDVLKVDRSFVAGLGRDPEETAIVRAVITLAHTLGMRVTAEGVETAEQAAHLCALGCAVGQGYLFAPPLPSAAAGLLLAQQHQCGERRPILVGQAGWVRAGVRAQSPTGGEPEPSPR